MTRIYIKHRDSEAQSFSFSLTFSVLKIITSVAQRLCVYIKTRRNTTLAPWAIELLNKSENNNK